ncbi:MAG: hypothetical protein KDD43_12515 [Bdellovibrionales bacterium]|nr:hypothetical protein [Bdellovibrionales bacterium]
MFNITKGSWQGQVSTRGEYHHRQQGGDGAPVLLLLHGYQQTAERFFQRVIDAIPEEYEVYALDGPFPVPFQQPEGQWRLGYSWYFYSTRQKYYYVPMSAGVDYLMSWLKAHHLGSRVRKIVGYSQGGYLAPFLAKELSLVDQVVGLHCRFRHEDLGEPGPFRLDALHGEKDGLVDPAIAEESHRHLVARGWRGSFQLIPDLGHSVSGEMKVRLTSLLQGGGKP